MKSEIEVKFLSVDHENIRQKLNSLGAELAIPMRLMRRAMLDHTDGRYQNTKKEIRFDLPLPEYFKERQK